MSRPERTPPREHRCRRLSWGENPPPARKRHFLSWAIENYLFAVASVMLLTGVVAVTVAVIQNYSGGKDYVTVDFYELGTAITSHNTTISLDRVTYQPFFDIRLDNYWRAQSGPLVIIDGIITNFGTAPVIAFFLMVDQPAGALVYRADGSEITSFVNTREVGLCPNESLRVPIIDPGRSTKFNLSLVVERNSALSWVKGEVQDGRLPALSFGPFAEASCGAIGDESLLYDTWRFDFQPQDLPDVELRDYYPFGSPTINEIGLSGRRYWKDWLPRPD